MGRKTPKWESELWSYLSSGDGIHCPVYQSCQLRQNNVWCLSENEDNHRLINEFIDEEDPDLADAASIKFKFPTCPGSSRIFKLVCRLAYTNAAVVIDGPPVPADLITRADDNLPIEIRKVPLKAYHGAVWRLSDCWLVQLNSNDIPARQRFTLYHEIFHILAHCKATPVFKKATDSQEGSFNELLADHFAATILIPTEWVKKLWPEVKDISRMAAIFDAPRSIVWFALKRLRLI